MATYFSKIITEQETEDYNYCDSAIAINPKYLKAFQLYSNLAEIDINAVKKVREITPIIANIQPEDFINAGLDVPEELVNDLLAKF